MDNINDWRVALRTRGVQVKDVTGNSTVGYKIFFWVYSADIWFGNVPIIKSLVGVNFIVLAIFKIFF